MASPPVRDKAVAADAFHNRARLPMKAPPASSPPPPKFPAPSSPPDAGNCFSCGSSAIDTALESNGFLRGQVAEVYGPPGSGKTQLALQVAANALKVGTKVLWIDTARAVSRRRLAALVGATDVDKLDLISFLDIPDLVHLGGWFFHRDPAFPADGTGLVVIDDIGTPYMASYPPGMESSASAITREVGKRRATVMGRFAAAFSELAAKRNCVVLVLNQMRTRKTTGLGLLLDSACNLEQWHGKMSTRLLLYYNNVPAKVGKGNEVRFCRATKVRGRPGKGVAIAFRIAARGITDVDLTGDTPICSHAGSDHVKAAELDTPSLDAPSSWIAGGGSEDRIGSGGDVEVQFPDKAEGELEEGPATPDVSKSSLEKEPREQQAQLPTPNSQDLLTSSVERALETGTGRKRKRGLSEGIVPDSEGEDDGDEDE